MCPTYNDLNARWILLTETGLFFLSSPIIVSDSNLLPTVLRVELVVPPATKELKCIMRKTKYKL